MDTRDTLRRERGARLAAWRAEHGLTLKTCATGAAVSHPTWCDWERGNRSPSVEKACAIERFTAGAIPVEHWGHGATVTAMVDVVRERGVAARKAKRAQVAA